MRTRVLSVLFFAMLAASAPLAAARSPGNNELVPVVDLQTHTNSIGMEFMLIPAGPFAVRIGQNEFGEPIFSEVTIRKPFYLGKYQVTQEQWVAIMGSNPARFKGRNNPVENVSWKDVQQFIRHLNFLEKHKKYRLPTEMEWILAASGGTGYKFFFINDPKTWQEVENALDAYAWLHNNSGGTTHPVGQKKPNQYGLYDIFGNVWEWIQDWYGDLPQERGVTDYVGPETGSGRVLRGGSWDHDTRNYQWTLRVQAKPDYRGSYVGFRLALSLEDPLK